jgi:hypothetical protein
LKRIRAHKSSSPESIIEMVLQAKKGSVIKLHTNTLLEARVAALEQANNAASERKKRKKRRIQEGRTLSQAEAEELIAQRDAKIQLEVERREERVQAGGSSKGIRRCKKCNKAGHNKRTCKKDVAEIGSQFKLRCTIISHCTVKLLRYNGGRLYLVISSITRSAQLPVTLLN